MIKARRFTPQKKWGQNFLVDENILDAVLEISGASGGDCVLEIGPGMGALTERLLERAGKVVAVEIDKMLIPILKEAFGERENLVLINEDIMKVDIARLAENANGGKKIKVAANLPYYITTPIVMRLLENAEYIESITVMVQKEVACRMTADPGSKAYGALSLAVRYYAEAGVMLDVPRNCFFPRPDVDSAVVKLDVYEPALRPIKAEDEKMLFEVIKAAFGQRRKTLANALSASPEIGQSAKSVALALSGLGIDPQIRGEALTLGQFESLARRLAR